MQTATKPKGKHVRGEGGLDWNMTTWALLKSVRSPPPIALGIRCADEWGRC